ncbi:SCL-interrupting locus protein-like protein [Diplodia corticola]|uniref:SCL-interrupting locus protein-like protein n=1 Tax=Diplodia corticola TaxID=236234 RepID=A0A1J9SD17_9PEZI|nr:SCL-interrupting locus protein-like protein [Diplodia corticola]OJD37461.1 SCL-interrupting locus protein-like protein [Diplodia corticola]
MLFAFFALCALTLFAPSVSAAVRFRHEAHGLQRQRQKQLADDGKEERSLDKRQLVVPSIDSSILESIMTLAAEEATASAALPTPTPDSTVYSYYYPSPSAIPTPITRQSQVETTYIPRITTCKGPPVALDVLEQSTFPYRNSTSTIFGRGPITCDTLYYTDTTTICATTLTGVASKVTISRCTQDVTFSSEFDATMVTSRSIVTGSDGHLSTITDAPSFQLRTTYYMAPWQSLTANTGVLPADVDVKVCHPRPGNGTMEDCIRMEESWAVLPVTLTSTFTSSVDVLATLTEGPGEYLVGTVHGQFVGNTTTVSLSTEMILNHVYEAETISRAPRIGPFATDSGLPGTPVSAPAIATATPSDTGSLPTIHLTSTRTRTRTVEVASSTASSTASEDEETTTLTDQSTSTLYTGTSTVYVDDNLLFTEIPSAAMLFAESQVSTPAVFAISETSTTPLSTPPDFSDSLTTTPTAIVNNIISLWMQALYPSVVEPAVVESTPSSVELPPSSLAPLVAESSSAAQWTPEFAPVTQSPSAGASPVLVPPPLFLHSYPTVPLGGIEPSATPSLSTPVQAATSATSASPSSFPIKWLNTTIPQRR